MRVFNNGRRRPCAAVQPFETLELRRLLSAAADVTGLTALRNDPAFAGVDGSGVGVAVIDTGTWAAHPDLRNNFVAYFDAVRFAATSAGSTVVDDAFDPNGHGTHVAGTVASTNPEIGVATAADLVAVRGLPSPGDPNPQFDPVDNALQWVLNNHQRFNIRVVNMSLGDYTTNFNSVPGGTRPAVFDELERLGIVTVIASGNNYGNFAQLGASSPGIFGTITVANTWPDAGQGLQFPQISGNGTRINFASVDQNASPDRLAASSQRSSLPNQVAAPGSGITSTWNDPAKPYNRISGTSMASPFVAGMVALMQDAAFTYGGRYLTAAEVQSIVVNTSDVITDATVPFPDNYRIPIGFDEQGRPFRAGPDQDLPESGLSFRRVNVLRAVQQVRAGVTGTTPDPDPAPVPVPGDEGDTNNVTSAAVVLPSLDATRQFTASGRIGTDGAVATGPDDIDLFRVTLESPGVVTFQTAPLPGGTNFDAYLRLFDDDGNQIAFADDTSGLYPTLQSVRLAAGTYYFGISSFNNSTYNIVTGGGAAAGQSSGDYSLTVGLTNPDPNGVGQGSVEVTVTNPNQINPATQLPSNYFPGRIGSDPHPFNAGERVNIGDTDVDMFRVVAPDNGTLTIEVESAGTFQDPVDSYVRVFNASLQQVAFNDDAAGTDSFLEVPIQEGQVYYVAVTTFGNAGFNPADPHDRTSTTPGEVGDYGLYLSFDNGDADGTVFEATQTVIGLAEQGVVGSDNGLLVGGANGGVRDVDFFQYTAEEGESGLLDLIADSPDGTLNPVLTLWQYDAVQNDVVRVYDTAGADARIIVPVNVGDTYYVSVTGLGNNDFNWFGRASGSGGDTGNYTLSSRLRPIGDLATLTDDSIAGSSPSAVQPGDQLLRTIGVDGGVTVGADDIDLYSFTPGLTGTLTIRAGVPGEETTDPVLRVFDEAGNELAFNDDAGPNTRDGAVNVSVNGGVRYFIGVNGSSAAARAYNPVTGAGAAAGDGGDYVLELSGITPGDVTIPFGGRQRATYTDASGDVVVVSLKGPGGGTVRFPNGSAGNVDATGIVLDGTTGASSLLIRTGPAGTPTGDILVNGSLKSLVGKTADLTGSISAAGTITKLALRNAGGGNVISTGSGVMGSYTFASVSDLSIQAGVPIKSIRATQWLDTDATPDSISAPFINSIAVAGEFGADVTAGQLFKGRFGSLVGSDVRAGDVIGTITAGAMSNSRVFAGVAPAVSNLPAAAADFDRAAATIRAVSVRGTFSNSLIAAPTIGRASLGTVSSTANGAVPFGVAADGILSMSALTPSGRLRLARLVDPSQSVLQEDFNVRVF